MGEHHVIEPRVVADPEALAGSHQAPVTGLVELLRHEAIASFGIAFVTSFQVEPATPLGCVVGGRLRATGLLCPELASYGQEGLPPVGCGCALTTEPNHALGAVLLHRGRRRRFAGTLRCFDQGGELETKGSSAFRRRMLASRRALSAGIPISVDGPVLPGFTAGDSDACPKRSAAAGPHRRSRAPSQRHPQWRARSSEELASIPAASSIPESGRLAWTSSAVVS